jgi:regulator of sirC expression with transglutaminase-like and TPR domain
MYGPDAEFSDHYLARASNRQILTRMLNNLKKIYLDAQAFDKGLMIVEMMLMVDPEEIVHYRDRGLLRVQLKRFEAAAKDLDYYVKHAPESEDRSKILEQLKELRRIQAMMN